MIYRALPPIVDLVCNADGAVRKRGSPSLLRVQRGHRVEDFPKALSRTFEHPLLIVKAGVWMVNKLAK